MATVSTSNANGTRRVLFSNAAGEVKALYLGGTPMGNAERIKGHVERIVACQISGDALPRGTAEYLRDLSPKLRKKFERVGLVAASVETAPAAKAVRVTLGELCGDFIAVGKADGKKGRTLINYGQARDSLFDYFTAARVVDTITEADADDWRRWMATDPAANKNGGGKAPLKPNTYNKRCSVAKQIFQRAKKRRLIKDNPFAEMKGLTIRADKTRDFMQSRQDAARVLAACPSAKWRLVYSLCRFGGLRCPSELQPLTVGDVDWAAGKLRIDSPKTGERFIPIFPELRPYLEAAIRELGDRAVDDPTTRLVDHTGKSWNFSAQMLGFIRKAGLDPWPKLFQNLRLTRENELLDDGWSERDVLAWIGHSRGVAEEHYWRVSDATFEAASKTTRKTTRQAEAATGDTGQGCCNSRGKTPVLAGLADSTSLSVPRRGVENLDFPGGKQGRSRNNAKNDALHEIIAAWPSLDNAARARVSAALRF